MSELCKKCNKKIDDSSALVSFGHGGLDFKVLRHMVECADCAQKRTVKVFDRYKDKLITIDKAIALDMGGLKIDWDYFVAKCKRYPNTFIGMVNLLLIIGVLSKEPAGKWFVECDLLRQNDIHVYFRSKHDAVMFANAHSKKISHVYALWFVDHSIPVCDIFKLAEYYRNS